MSILLFFVLPISIIILSIVLQKILKCPALVAATFFAILLIIAYATPLGNSFLIYVIIYTILAYVTAVLTRLICNIWARFGHCFNNGGNCICGDSCNRGNGLLTASTFGNSNNGNCCQWSSTNTANDVSTASIISDVSTANNINSANNLSNSNCGRNSASFTVTSSQPNPVFYLTSRSGNQRENEQNCDQRIRQCQENQRQNCCCSGRRRSF